MSLELMSAKYYEEPDAKELRKMQQEAVRCGGKVATSFRFFLFAFWVVLFGGSSLLFFGAVRAANQQGNQGHQPAISMLSFCMNLVNWNWDSQVEQRIRSNQPRPLKLERVPEIDIEQDFWLPEGAR